MAIRAIGVCAVMFRGMGAKGCLVRAQEEGGVWRCCGGRQGFFWFRTYGVLESSVAAVSSGRSNECQGYLCSRVLYLAILKTAGKS